MSDPSPSTLPALRLPTPVDLVTGTFKIVEFEIRIVRELLQAPARILTLIDALEALLARVAGLIDRVEALLDDVDHTISSANVVIRRVNSTVDGADAVIGRVTTTVDSADGVVAHVNTTVDGADRLLSRVDPLLDFGEATVSQIRPVIEHLLLEAELDEKAARQLATRIAQIAEYADRSLRLLEPISDEVLRSISPREVRAVVKLIEFLPELTDSLRDEVLPVLATLDTVAPEVHQILDVANECLEALAGIPGFGYLRRRGEGRKVEDGSRKDP